MATDVPYEWRKTGETYTCKLCGKPTSNRKLFTGGPVGGKDGYSWCDECISDFDRELEWGNEQSCKEEITSRFDRRGSEEHREEQDAPRAGDCAVVSPRFCGLGGGRMVETIDCIKSFKRWLKGKEEEVEQE